MANLNAIFHAMADGTRRAVVEQLALGPLAVSALAERHAMALPSFLKHLRVLEEAGWIETRKIGRTRLCRLKPDASLAAGDWLGRQRRVWEGRLDRLDAFLEGRDDERNPENA
jgi:DNA-binding transcriptional ArsR family regulator